MPHELSDDGLPVSEVGEWSLEKHDRLRRYIDISRAVRKKFLPRAGATYIDLYCGPGRSKLKDSGRLIEGSPLVAAVKAREGASAFSDIFVADENRDLVGACAARLSKAGFASRHHHGGAEDTVRRIAHDLDHSALHFAFLDPFGLDDLPFTIVRALAKLRRMDILIHVSVQDLQRNLRRYVGQPDGPLDRLSPGWRSKIDLRARDDVVRQNLLQHWLAQIRKLDMAPSEGIELVSGTRKQRLYWLVFVSRHELAHEFWNKIRNVTGQGRLDI